MAAPSPAGVPAGAEPRAGSPGRTIARLARQLDRALAAVDLSLPQYRLLVFLSEVDTAMASALARRLEVSRPSITALVDGLVARGLVERTTARDDRRRVEHRLTGAGEAVLHAADEVVDARLDAVAARLDPDDRAVAFDGLEAWRTALTRAREAHLAQT